MTDIENAIGKAGVKKKVITQVKELAIKKDMEMEKAQDKVAKRIHKKTGKDLETSKKVVRYIIAEFIQAS